MSTWPYSYQTADPFGIVNKEKPSQQILGALGGLKYTKNISYGQGQHFVKLGPSQRSISKI